LKEISTSPPLASPTRTHWYPLVPRSPLSLRVRVGSRRFL
jgi:hypothetical protein